MQKREKGEIKLKIKKKKKKKQINRIKRMKRCSTCTVKCFLSASPDPEKKASSMLVVTGESGI